MLKDRDKILKLSFDKIGNQNQYKGKLVGVYVDKDTDQDLILYSLIVGLTKSTILRRTIEKLLQEKDIILEIASLLQTLFHKEGEKWTGMSSSLFKIHVQDELRQKKIQPEMIFKIFSKFDELENESKPTNRRKGK